VSVSFSVLFPPPIASLINFSVTSHKAHIILAARSEQKGRELEKNLKEQTKNENIEWLPLDLEDLNSVKKFTELFLAKNLPLNILLLNAGMQTFGLQKNSSRI